MMDHRRDPVLGYFDTGTCREFASSGLCFEMRFLWEFESVVELVGFTRGSQWHNGSMNQLIQPLGGSTVGDSNCPPICTTEHATHLLAIDYYSSQTSTIWIFAVHCISLAELKLMSLGETTVTIKVTEWRLKSKKQDNEKLTKIQKISENTVTIICRWLSDLTQKNGLGIVVIVIGSLFWVEKCKI